MARRSEALLKRQCDLRETIRLASGNKAYGFTSNILVWLVPESPGWTFDQRHPTGETEDVIEPCARISPAGMSRA
jgi:hypothetical protein